MRQRNRRGVISAGITAVALIVIAAALLILLLVSTGCSILAEERLGRINTLATSFASAHSQDTDVEGETRAFVLALMPQMGMTPSNVSIVVARRELNNSPAVQVTLCNQFRLVGLAGILPNLVSLRDVKMAQNQTEY